MTWDVIVVGAGPAGSAAAIGALRADPSLRVALLDRSGFPRDKACGDGIAPHVIDLLYAAGVTGVVDDWEPVPRLSLRRGSLGVDAPMARSSWVIPRTVFDDRLVTVAQEAGATFLRCRVHEVNVGPTITVNSTHTGRVVVGADGAHSVVRRVIGVRTGPMAIALRGYARTPRSRAARQVIVFDTKRQPAYAWSFDRGDGWSNVGYGALLDQRARPTKVELLGRLETLLPGAADDGASWRGHHLPLSTGRWAPPSGPVLLAGDAAQLVNPLTGEGIYYAVATGLAAGRAAAAAITSDNPASAGSRYAAMTTPLLGAHLRHVQLAARLCSRGAVLDAGLRASARDRRVFDDLVELGLARGRLTATVVGGLLHEWARPSAWRGGGPIRHDNEESAACEL
jgi:geranylgeranyl reductase family protein